MQALQTSTVDEASPTEAFAALISEPSAALIDVRTQAEWTFTGLPDVAETGKPLWQIEWVSYPTMAPNPRFLDQIVEHAGGELPQRLFFICRSGARSLAAARAIAMASEQADRPIHCTNVAEGYEGDLDAGGHRGTKNGWKVRGLPWRQT